MENTSQSILLTGLGYKSASEKVELFKNVTAEQWSEVAELAREHGVVPLLHHKLSELGIKLPVDLAEKIRQEHLKLSFRNIFLFREMDKLLELFIDRGIKVIVLKGAYLSRQVYDNIGIRGMSDIDLLVKKEDLAKVDSMLLTLGAEPKGEKRLIAKDNNHLSYHVPGQGIMLEIHWSIVSPKYPCLIDIEGLWLRAKPFDFQKIETMALSFEDLLLHLCLHTVLHAHAMQIRMLCDIGELVEQFGDLIDWQEVSDRTAHWEITRAVYTILRLAVEILNVKIPSKWLTSVKPEFFKEEHFNYTRDQLLLTDISSGEIKIGQLWQVRGFKNKLSVISKKIFLTREDIAVMYPNSTRVWFIYFIYPFKRLTTLTIRHLMFFLKLASRDKKAKTQLQESNKINALRDWLLSD